MDDKDEVLLNTFIQLINIFEEQINMLYDE